MSGVWKEYRYVSQGMLATPKFETNEHEKRKQNIIR